MNAMYTGHVACTSMQCRTAHCVNAAVWFPPHGGGALQAAGIAVRAEAHRGGDRLPDGMRQRSAGANRNVEMCWIGMLSVIVARTSTYMLHSSMTHAHTRSNQPRDLPSQSSSHQRTTIECDQHDCAPFRVAGYQAKYELLPSTSTGLYSK